MDGHCACFFSATSSSGESSDSGYQRKLGEQRAKLNEFLSVCNTGITVSANKKKWQDASVRTRKSQVSKAREFVVAVLNVITPGDTGRLWKALKASQSVEKSLGIAEGV